MKEIDIESDDLDLYVDGKLILHTGQVSDDNTTGVDISKEAFEGNIEFTSTSITEFEFNKVEEVKRTIYRHSFSMRLKPRAQRPGPVIWLIKDGKVVDVKEE